MKINKKIELIKKIIFWKNQHRFSINEIVLIGSQARISDNDIINNKSDWDFMIFKTDNISKDDIYVDLLKMGEDFGIVIHPLIIEDSEKEEKMNIDEYQKAYFNGQKIF